MYITISKWLLGQFEYEAVVSLTLDRWNWRTTSWQTIFVDIQLNSKSNIQVITDRLIDNWFEKFGRFSYSVYCEYTWSDISLHQTYCRNVVLLICCVFSIDFDSSRNILSWIEQRLRAKQTVTTTYWKVNEFSYDFEN